MSQQIVVNITVIKSCLSGLMILPFLLITANTSDTLNEPIMATISRDGLVRNRCHDRLVRRIAGRCTERAERQYLKPGQAALDHGDIHNISRNEPADSCEYHRDQELRVRAYDISVPAHHCKYQRYAERADHGNDFAPNRHAPPEPAQQIEQT